MTFPWKRIRIAFHHISDYTYVSDWIFGSEKSCQNRYASKHLCCVNWKYDRNIVTPLWNEGQGQLSFWRIRVTIVICEVEAQRVRKAMLMHSRCEINILDCCNICPTARGGCCFHWSLIRIRICERGTLLQACHLFSCIQLQKKRL